MGKEENWHMLQEHLFVYFCGRKFPVGRASVNYSFTPIKEQQIKMKCQATKKTCFLAKIYRRSDQNYTNRVATWHYNRKENKLREIV